MLHNNTSYLNQALNNQNPRTEVSSTVQRIIAKIEDFFETPRAYKQDELGIEIKILCTVDSKMAGKFLNDLMHRTMQSEEIKKQERLWLLSQLVRHGADVTQRNGANYNSTLGMAAVNPFFPLDLLVSIIAKQTNYREACSKNAEAGITLSPMVLAASNSKLLVLQKLVHAYPDWADKTISLLWKINKSGAFDNTIRLIVDAKRQNDEPQVEQDSLQSFSQKRTSPRLSVVPAD